MKFKFGIDTLMFWIAYLVFTIFLIQYVEGIEAKIGMGILTICISTGTILLSLLEGNTDE